MAGESARIQNVPEDSVSELVMKTEADLTGKVYCFATGDAPDQVALASGGDTPLGILQDAPKAAAGAPQGATVRTGGLSKLLLGGTVAQGQFVKPTTNGVGVAATTDKDSYGAKALESGVSGDYIAVQICHGTLSAT